MKTFKEFLDEVNIITERYYEPNEKKPSGRTPVEDAKRRGITGDLLKRVERGADNKKWDTTPHPDFHILQGTRSITYWHKPTGTRFTINTNLNKVKSGKLKGKPVHEVGFEVNRGSNDSLSTRMKKIKEVKSIWREHIAPRAPHGSIIHSRTKYNESNKSRGRTGNKRKNTRALKYEDEGMGPLTHGSQFGLVGRPPSPRQAARGAVRLLPVTLTSRNLETPPTRGIDYA